MTKAVSNRVDHILPHIYTASAFVNMKHVLEKMQYRFGVMYGMLSTYVIHYQNPISIILRLKKRAKEISDDHQAQGGPLKKTFFSSVVSNSAYVQEVQIHVQYVQVVIITAFYF